ncbi:hypothetical protein ACSS6N_15080 [Peribacillus frigoritolerans]|uniref:hypothetical protein n=1 Tax=Peribacillus frigoritolerans TaxID=450367 RepID=UPI003F86FD43
MPEIKDINNLLEDFISRVRLFGPVPDQTLPILKDFLLHIKFTNPRKLKKLFNKYIFLCTLENSNTDRTNTSRIYQIPKNFNNHEPVQMLFTLFIILLYEFNRDTFELIYNNQIKIGKLKNIFNNPNSEFYIKNNHSKPFTLFLNDTAFRWKNNPINITGDILYAFSRPERDNRFFELLLLFLPLDIKLDIPRFNFNNGEEMYEQLNSFVNEFQASDEKLLSSFITFLLQLFDQSDSLDINLKFNVHTLVTMVNFYL